MQRENTNSNGSGRRTFLKTAGAASVALAGVPLASAQGDGNQPTTDRYEQGLELRKKNGWNVDQWRHWLARHDFDFKYQDVALYTPHPENDNIDKGRKWGHARTDNRPDKNSLDASETWHRMTYTRPFSGPDRFNFDWSLNDGWDDSADPPNDWPGMSFEHNYYNFPSDPNKDLGPWVSNSSRGDSIGSSYWTFEYNSDVHAANTTGRFGSYFDMPLLVESSTDNTRQIYTRYHHTWNDVQVSSIGLDSGGIVTVNFEEVTKRWVTTAWCSEEQMDDGVTYEDKNPEINSPK